MRTDFRRRSVFFSVGLLVTGTLLASEVFSSPADAFVRRPTHRRTVDREAIGEKRIARQDRAARSATRQQLARPAPKPMTAAASPSDEMVWQRLRNCETGGRYDRNTGNGYYGAYQFSARTWRGLGYTGLPHRAPPEVQDEAARKLQARSGWGQWPACARRIGAR